MRGRPPPLPAYHRRLSFGWVVGDFAVRELVRRTPENVIDVRYHGRIDRQRADRLARMCHEAHLPWLRDDAAVEQKRSKGSADVMAVYRKPIAPPRATFERRVCVVSPREHGNLGTIVRTAAAFGVTDVVTVGGIDVWSPHVVRASIGASFAMHVAGIDDLDDLPPGPHEATTWYLDGAGSRTVGEVGPLREPWTLVVGPEWPGLDPSVVDTARSIRIDHGRDVESLNVAVAVGIALHALVVHPGSTDGTGTGAAVPTR